MKPAEDHSLRQLLRLAEKIADSRPVDWSDVTATLDDPQLASRVDKLKILEDLALAFRSDGQAGGTPESPERPVLFRWGPLVVHEHLGSGGFGEVYRATDTALGREVALKLRPAGPSRVDRGGHRYIDEARRLARLRHANVVAVHGAGEYDNRIGFWTDLIDGRTLADLVAEGGPFGADEAAAMGQAVCRALAAVHGAGLVHGDVKPSNVMRERGGRIVLIDFGAASVFREHAPARLTEAFQGTLAVLAPEVLEGATPSPAADIYATGILLYYLLTADYPVRAESLPELLDRHRRGDAVALRDRRPDLPSGFIQVVERALAADPGKRYPSAGALERALVDSLRSQGSAQATPDSANRPRFIRRLAIPAVLVITIVVGFAAWQSMTDPAAQRASVPAAYRLTDVDALSTMVGNHGEPVFSPDGRMVAFVSDDSGIPEIWIQSLAGGPPFQVTHGDRPASRPRWTVGDEIVFARRGQGIWTVPALGGDPRRIVEHGYNPDVTPDGEWVIFEFDRQLWRVAADGGAPQPLDSVPRRYFEFVEARPAVSPDGTRVAYFMQDAGPTGDLWVVPLTGGDPERLTFDRAEAGDPAWTPDGERIVFSSRRAGTRNLWQVSAAGGTPEPLTVGTGEDSAPVVSPDGIRVLFTNTQHRWVLSVLDPDSGDILELLERRVPVWLPQVSPAGDRVAFFQATGPAHHLYTVKLDGSGLRQVTSGAQIWNLHPRWSADGAWLYYYEERPHQALRRVPAMGGESLPVADGWTWLNRMHAVPGPAGNRIAYLDQDPDAGTTMIWDLDSDRHRALPDPHLHGLEWSPDGSWIMGFSHDNQIRLCPADGGDCAVLTSGYRPRFLRDDETIYFHRPAAERQWWEVWKIGLDGGGETALGITGPHHTLDPTFDVTPDGRVVYTRFEQGRSELWSGRLAPAD